MGQIVGRTTTQLLVVITGAGIKAILQKREKSGKEETEERGRWREQKQKQNKTKKAAARNVRRPYEETDSGLNGRKCMPERPVKKSRKITPASLFAETPLLLSTLLPNPLAPLLQPDNPTYKPPRRLPATPPSPPKLLTLKRKSSGCWGFAFVLFLIVSFWFARRLLWSSLVAGQKQKPPSFLSTKATKRKTADKETHHPPRCCAHPK